jgi:long-chain acyl-CoA synthetase
MSSNSDLRSLHDVLLRANREHPESEAFIYRAGGEEHVVTYRKFFEDVLLLTRAFAEKKIGKGTKVLFFSDNRYAWIVTDFALVALGAISVPRGSDSPTRELEYILDHSDCEYLIAETMDLLNKHAEMFAQKKLRNVFIIEGEEEHKLFSNIYSYNNLMKDRTITPKDIEEFETRGDNHEMDDIFTLIYTSGTTGNPKGVILTHRNVMYNVDAIPKVVNLERTDYWLSVLPTWHIFERAAEYMAISSGGCTVYSSVKTFSEDLQYYKPTLVCSVPRLWEALYTKINAALEDKGASKARIFRLLVKASAAYRRNLRLLKNQLPRFQKDFVINTLPCKLLAVIKIILLTLPYKLAQKKFVLVQERFGGQLRLAVSGGGSLPKYLDEWIDALGIRIVNAYGMTECAPAISARGLNCEIFGTLGPALPGTELRITDEQDQPVAAGVEGEIQVKGPQVMPGYYNNDEENAKTFTSDGFLKTGDLGKLTISGELLITGRAKEIIVLASGENIDPSRIEGAITMLPFVKDAVLVGQDRKGLAALIVPDFEKLKEFALEKLHRTKHSEEEMIDDKGLADKTRQEINKLLAPKEGFKAYEKLMNLKFLEKDFTPGEELTNTLKKKRHVIERKYHALIDKLFS